jgi:hypothetical protein
MDQINIVISNSLKDSELSHLDVISETRVIAVINMRFWDNLALALEDIIGSRLVRQRNVPSRDMSMRNGVPVQLSHAINDFA